MQSYLNKPFLIDNAQARLRQGDDLMTFVTENGAPKLIPNGTEVSVTDARVLRDLVS